MSRSIVEYITQTLRCSALIFKFYDDVSLQVLKVVRLCYTHWFTFMRKMSFNEGKGIGKNAETYAVYEQNTIQFVTSENSQIN